MSEDQPAPAEPSNAELLAFMTQAFAELGAKVDDLIERVEAVEGKLAGLDEDVVAVKVDAGWLVRHIADFQTWARRHQDNPNAHGTAA